MITENTHVEVYQSTGMAEKARHYWSLLKVRLSFLVVFSGAFGYLLGMSGNMDWVKFGSLLLGSFLVTGAANIINQIKEKDLDKLMTRTRNRPLPTGKLTTQEATIYTLLLATAGSAILCYLVSPLVAGLSLLSLILYAFVYTPLKQISSISVLVGAFPGAMPPLIGWAAATGAIGFEAFLLFGIQFIWQFPHFWSIAWIGHDDYTRAGFKMLPSKGGRTLVTALQISIYTLFLIPAGIMPAKFGITGPVSAVVAVICGTMFLTLSFSLIKTGSRKAALRMMFGSFFYLPIIQIAYLLDKL